MNVRTAPRQPQAEQISHDLQLTDVWKFILRRRWIFAVCCLLGLAAGFIAYLRAPRLYTAVVTVEMNRDASSGLGLQDLSGAGSALGMGQDLMTDMLTQQAVLTNASTAKSVIDQLGLMSIPPYANPVKKPGFGVQLHKNGVPEVSETEQQMDSAIAIFRSKLVVSPVKNTRLLEVQFTDADPIRAAKVANTVVEAYLANHTRTRYEATSKASTWLSDQLNDLQHKAEDIHHQVAQLENSSGLISSGVPSEGTNGAGGTLESGPSSPEIAKLMALNSALSQSELNRIQQGTIFRLSQTNDPNALLDVNGAKLAMGDGTLLAANSQSMQMIANLRSQEAALKLKLASAKVTYAAQNPVIQEIRNQLDSIHAQMADEMGRVREAARRNYELAQQNEDAIRKEAEAQQQKVSTVGNRLADLAFLREEEGAARKLYQDLYSRLQEADIAAGVRSSGMAVVDPARPPTALSSPNFRRNLGFGLLAGAFLGLLIALLVQLRDTKLNIPEDFAENSPYPLLGVIPGFEQANRTVYGAATPAPVTDSDDQAWIIRSPQSPVAEAYRLVRTSIMLSRADVPPRVMIFTSPVGGDGKSTTTYNLAAAFAAQSSRVLLLDADMRRSTISKLAGLPKGPGLSNLLSGHSSLEEAIHPSPHVPFLSILQAGVVPPDPSELLGSQRFAKLIADLREQFDYVLIDSPPALLVTDPIVASTAADAIICVVRAGKTEKPTLRRFWETMQQPNTLVLGYIVNDFNRKLQSYAYGYEGYGPSGYRYYSPTKDKPE